MPCTSTGTRRRRAVPRLSAALAAVLALSACAGGTEIQTGGEEDRFISGDGSATVFEAGSATPPRRPPGPPSTVTSSP